MLRRIPFSGHLFVFRGKRGDLIKLLCWDGQGLCLFAKRLRRDASSGPRGRRGAVALSPAQLAMLLEGIDWRAPRRTDRPTWRVDYSTSGVIAAMALNEVVPIEGVLLPDDPAALRALIAAQAAELRRRGPAWSPGAGDRDAEAADRPEARRFGRSSEKLDAQ